MNNCLIIDAGATKSACLLILNKKKIEWTIQGISPYFLNKNEIVQILEKELISKISTQYKNVEKIFYYGTGLSNPTNVQILKKSFYELFDKSVKLHFYTDILGACHATAGNNKGIVCILGTGSNLAIYNGKKIIQQRNGIGYILGDEGSGAYMGKQIIQYYLYDIFDNDLKEKFEKHGNINKEIILENVYKKPFANRYLASLTPFLSNNRGHFMIENIIEDSLNDFFIKHIIPFQHYHHLPIHFVGGIAFHFKDMLIQICNDYNLKLGNIFQSPITYLNKYYQHLS
ncbi:MAG: N-acetylglucosamine kinase [Sediminibacterium sp.]|nr:N-acetylglucosamine kinase [Sediminibacterium sp.]